MNREAKQFETDYLPLQPVMQRMAESILGDEQDAADLVQDCFVTLWNERQKLRKVVNREAWCITLVKRRCIDLLRRRHPTEDVDRLADLTEEAPHDDQRLELAMNLIKKLPERQARALNLRHFDGFDTADIARTMNISEGNVYTLLSRAYASLKQMILQYERD